MSIISNGKPGAILQPASYRRDTARGWQNSIKWRGPKKDLMSQIGKYNAAFYNVDFSSQTGAVWDLSITGSNSPDGSAEAPINIWESSSNVIQKDIFSNPNLKSLTTQDIIDIRKAVQDAQTGGTIPTTFTGIKLNTFGLMLLGANTWDINQPILRHTQVTSQAWLVKTAYAGVGSIFTDPGAPSAFLIGLPASGDGTANIPGGSNFGWKKEVPTIQTAPFCKYQIVQDWKFGEYSTLLYGGLN